MAKQCKIQQNPTDGTTTVEVSTFNHLFGTPLVSEIFQRVTSNIAKRLGITNEQYAKRLSILTSQRSVRETVDTLLEQNMDGRRMYDTSDSIQDAEVLFQSEEHKARIRAAVPSLHPKNDAVLLRALGESTAFIQYLDSFERELNTELREQRNSLQTELSELYRSGKGGTPRVAELKSQLVDIKNAIKQDEQAGPEVPRSVAERILEEEFSQISEEALTTDKYLVQELSDKWLQSEADYARDNNNEKDAQAFEYLLAHKGGEEYHQQLAHEQDNQRSHLGSVISYLKATEEYPIEFKSLVLQTLLTYNVNSEGVVTRRTRLTVGLHNNYSSGSLPAIYYEMLDTPDINIVEEYHKNRSKDYLSGAERQSIVEKYTVEDRPNGKWIKIPQNGTEENVRDLYLMAKESHRELAKWCTGGSVVTAKSHNDGGDFYFFVDNNYSPRLAMRYNGTSELAESRGLGEGQVIYDEDLSEAKYFYDNYKGGKKYLDTYDFNRLYKTVNSGTGPVTDADKLRFLEVREVGDGSYNKRASNAKIEEMNRYLANNIYDFAPVIAKVNGVNADEVSVELTPFAKVLVGDFTLSDGEYATEVVYGTVKVESDARVDNLKIVNGDANFENWQGSAPNLESIERAARFSGWEGDVPKLKSIEGDAFFNGWEGDAPKLESIGGDVFFDSWKGDAPNLKSIGGDVFSDSWQGSASKLESIGGTAFFENWEGSAPNLKSIGGVAFFTNWKGDAPKLESIGARAVFNNWKKSVPNLKSIGGRADFMNWEGSAPKLESIEGDTNFENWQGSAPNLKSIGGRADFMNWQGSAPKLESIGGRADFNNWQGEAPNLKSIKGSAHFANWKGDAPKLESVGGSAFFNNWKGEAPNLKSIGGAAFFNNWEGSAPKLKSIEGDALFMNWKGDAPKLESVGGNAQFNGWEKSAPKLKNIEGDAYFNGWEGDAPSLESIGEIPAIEEWQGSAPNLRQVFGQPYGEVFNQGERGAIIKTRNKSIMVLGRNADATTPLHEIAHEYETVLTPKERETILEWAGHGAWTVETSEAFAKGFEKYLFEGVSQNKSVENIFEKFAKFLRQLISDAASYFGGINELNQDMIDIYDLMTAQDNMVDETVTEESSQISLTLDEVTQQVQKTRLAKKVHTLSSQQIEQELIRRGVDSNVAKQVSAWHGSPHLFDKFSLSAMGTGEGNQAFGWGLYFTDLESIARDYAKVLSRNIIKNPKITFDGQILSSLTAYKIERYTDQKQFENKSNLIEKIQSFLNDAIAEKKRYADNERLRTAMDKYIETYSKEIDALKKAKSYSYDKGRNLYKVSLHKGKQPSEYTWLEWDKNITTEFNDSIRKQAKKEGLLTERTGKSDVISGVVPTGVHFITEGVNGKVIYDSLEKTFGSSKEASLFLLRAGIDGIKYPEGTIARGTTSDTARGFNYVVFDENAITIEEHIQFQNAGLGLLPNGFVDLNTKEVFINKETANLDTPIHEFSHLFTNILKQTNPQVYEKGIDLVKKEIFDKSKVLKSSDVATGKKVEIFFNKNTEKAPNFGSRFGQDVEPSGNYITQKESDMMLPNYEQGVVTFNNPLVIDVNDENIISYKSELSKKYNNLTGKKLTEALKKEGYDGIITTNGNYLGEIIAFDNSSQIYSDIQDIIDYVRTTQPDLKGESFYEEILTELTGRRGSELLNSKKKSGIIDWLKEFWNEIKDMLGLTQYSWDEVKDMNLQQFTEAMAVDLLRGEELKFENETQAIKEISKDKLLAVHNLSIANLLNVDKQGGLAVPSLAVINADNPFTSFGEITLVADKSLIDPRASRLNKAFASDSYSIRYPSITYTPNHKKLREFNKRVKKELPYLDERDSFRNVDDRGRADVENDNVIKLLFLKEQGKEKDFVFRESKISDKYLDRFEKLLEKTKNSFDFTREGGKVYQEFSEIVKEKAVEELKQRNLEEFEFNSLLPVVGKVSSNDYYAFRQSLNARKNKELNVRETLGKNQVDVNSEEYQNFVDEIYDNLEVTERIFKGYTPSGNRRYVPHTIENVVRMMKGGARKGEGYFYGVGSVRAGIVKQFKSIKDIKDSQDKIVSSEEFEKVKEEINNEFIELGEKLKPFYKYQTDSFGYFDNVGESLIEFYNRGRSQDFNELDKETEQEVKDFLEKLYNLPTEYFEVKIERAVDLSEFKGALIPKNTPQTVRNILESKGLKVVEYSEKADYNEFADLRFQNRITGEQGARNLDQVLKDSNVVTDLSGNQIEVDSSSITTYESEAGPIRYITDSNGDMQMVRLGEQDGEFQPISKESYELLVEKLTGVFGKFGTNVVYSYEEFKERASRLGIDTETADMQIFDLMTTKDGEIYGAKLPDGTIYLNPNRLNANTPIHEFAHVWEQLMPKKFTEGVELLKKTELGKQVYNNLRNNPGYSKKSNDQVWREALVTVIANEGESIYHSNDTTPFKKWVKDFFNQLAKIFGLDSMSPEEALDVFVRRAAGEILGIDPMVAEVTEEMDAIRDAAIADGTYMLAPNGQPSNLSEKQWVEVRTNNFKNWFSSIEDNRSIIEENFDNIINKLGISKNCE